MGTKQQFAPASFASLTALFAGQELGRRPSLAGHIFVDVHRAIRRDRANREFRLARRTELARDDNPKFAPERLRNFRGNRHAAPGYAKDHRPLQHEGGDGLRQVAPGFSPVQVREALAHPPSVAPAGEPAPLIQANAPRG